MTSPRPDRQTRQTIERELAAKKRVGAGTAAEFERKLRRKTESLQACLQDDPTSESARRQISVLLAMLDSLVNGRGFGARHRRRPDDGTMPALVEPPRGPLPLAGGAEAPLDFRPDLKRRFPFPSGKGPGRWGLSGSAAPYRQPRSNASPEALV